MGYADDTRAEFSAARRWWWLWPPKNWWLALSTVNPPTDRPFVWRDPPPPPNFG